MNGHKARKSHTYLHNIFDNNMKYVMQSERVCEYEKANVHESIHIYFLF